MKYCKNCGSGIDDNANVCPVCGTFAQVQPIQQVQYYNSVPSNESYTGMAILGFFFPVIGMLICCMNIAKNPKKAQAAGTGANIRNVVRIALAVIIVLISIVCGGFILEELFDDIGYMF